MRVDFTLKMSAKGNNKPFMLQISFLLRLFLRILYKRLSS